MSNAKFSMLTEFLIKAHQQFVFFLSLKSSYINIRDA